MGLLFPKIKELSSRRKPGPGKRPQPLDPGFRRDDSRTLQRLAAFAGVTFMLLAFPARAEEFVYSPEGCEFRMVFPDEPHAVRRCHPQFADKCELMTGYTKVFDLNATINFYVSCKPAPQDYRKQFTKDLMQTTLLARPGVDKLEVYNMDYQDTADGVVGVLLGAGPTASGNDPMVYVAQLMIGNTSVFSLEAELIGQQIVDVDKSFADILRSLQSVKAADAAKPPPPAEKEEAEEAPAQPPEKQ